ncbi:MAG: hydrogenase expression/formation protein HypE [Sulfolobales archaeon]
MSGEFIRLAHGSGGVEMRELLEKLIFSRIDSKLKRFGDEGVGIDMPDDGAGIKISDDLYLVISTDSYTVKPLFFPGGDIGMLAASGSINDVLMMGGIPIAIMDSIVIEEGFPMRDLERIIGSFIEILRSEGVALVGGDFKVMPRGELDGIIINTVALGLARRLIIDSIKPGDKIIVSDYVGDHGAIIMLYRMGLAKDPETLERSRIRSDVKPLTSLMKPVLEKYPEYIHAARDPTRGGLAGVLNEWVRDSEHVIYIDEDEIPIRDPVRRYSEMLGIDPLYLASEGVAVFSVDPSISEEFISFIRKIGYPNARIVGEVRSENRYKGRVIMRTSVGGVRIVDPPRGELIPRIC